MLCQIWQFSFKGFPQLVKVVTFGSLSEKLLKLVNKSWQHLLTLRLAWQLNIACAILKYQHYQVRTSCLTPVAQMTVKYSLVSPGILRSQ